MKNKFLNKIITIILVSLIGLTSISSFNHVSADELDNFSYTNQLVSSSNINHLDYPPVVPEPNNPKTWIGVLAALFTVIGIKNSLSFNKTINVLQNGFADNRTGVFVDSLIKNNPSFNFGKFASDNNVLSGNYTNINPSLIKDLHVDPKLCLELENYNTNNYYNGGNKNYYTNNDYSSNDNYSVFDSSTNNLNYTYNNQHYNYTVNNMFYNYVTNEYTFNITNNQNITYINNYNNTTIISPSGQTQKLYYKLPDGSNSLNLTEEQAKKGYKTSLNVASYSNGYDDDDLNFLFHFDGNEYDSAYPIANYTLKAIPNSVDYIDSSNQSFGQAIAFSDSFDLSVEGSNYNNYYSFRIYPQINDKWSLKINGVDIGSRISKIETKYEYVEWTQNSYSKGGSVAVTVINNSSNSCGIQGYTRIGTMSLGNANYQHTCIYNPTSTTSTTQRTYNIINNKLFEDSGTNLLNYNQWNFISIDTSGKVFINGVDTNITAPLDQFKISVTGDSLTYIDELASFKTNRSNTSPSIPFDSNVSYFLPPVLFTLENVKRELKSGVYQLKSLRFNDKASINTGISSNWGFKFEAYLHFNHGNGNIIGCSSDNSLFGFRISDSKFKFYNKDSIDISLRPSSIYETHYYMAYIESDFSKFTIDSTSETYNVLGSYPTLNENLYFGRTPYDIANNNIQDFIIFGVVTLNATNPDIQHHYYPCVTSNGLLGLFDDVSNNVLTSPSGYLVGGDYVYDSKLVKQNTDVKNNMLLIQSLIPINSSKFGGIRPSNPSSGDVYCSVNENGNITSVQQYNGIEWRKVVGSIYNDALGLWVNAEGFNIFIDNWSYQDIDYRADNPDTNILIRFLTSQFNKVTDLLDSIIEKIKGISSDETVINNYQNNYNVDINTNIDNLINISKDYDKDIDLNSPSYNVDDSILTDINNLAVGSKGIFKALDDSGFSILYLAPLILLLVGLLL